MYVFAILIIVTIGLIIGFKVTETTPSKQQYKISKKASSSPDKQSRKINPPDKCRVYDTVRFKYLDREEGVTERTVDLISGKIGDQFKGYCYLRKEERTFYFDRIHGFKVMHVATGEITTPMEWRYRLQGTKIAKKAVIEERRKIEAEREHVEANETWLSLTEPAPRVEFEGKRFALAGDFSSGNISDSVEKVERKGGLVQTSPNGKTDYIVVNPDKGVNMTFKKAIHKLLARGIQPVIITEKHWLSSLDNK